MITSRNWKLDMQDYITDFVNKENGGPQMADALRYYLTQIAPETKDSEFMWKGFQELRQLGLATRSLFDAAFIRVLVRRLHAAHEALAHPRRIM